MKTTVPFLLLGLIFMLIHTVAQNQPDKFNTRNSNGMMWFDLSALDWTQAFDSLHTIMKERYPYTEWKAIDRDQKWLFSHPKIMEAQNQGDTVKHTEALFEYLYSIPDGHVMYRGGCGCL